MLAIERLAIALIAAACVCTVAPAQDRANVAPQKAAATTIPGAQRVDINHASLEAMLKVPGMTQSWAGRILRFRPYRTKQDLLERGIVSSEVYDRIKPFVIAHRDRH